MSGNSFQSWPRALRQAPEVWRELYPPARSREAPRFDKHVRRPNVKRTLQDDGASRPTERAWIQKRRKAVEELAPCLREADVANLVEAGIWTEKHDAEMNFQNQKFLTRLFEAIHSNTVRQDEVPEEVYQQYLQHYEDKRKTVKQREAAEQRMMKMVSQQCPPEENLRGLLVFVQSDADRSAAMDLAFDRRQWTLTVHLHEAQVIVTSQPSCRSATVTLAAGLNGGWIVTPDMVLRNEGFALKFRSQPATKRKIYISDAAEHEHPECADLVRARVGRSWTVIDDLEQFAAAKQKAINQKVSPSVVAFIGDNEAASFAGVAHAFSVDAFLEFFCKLDLESSCAGS